MDEAQIKTYFEKITGQSLSSMKNVSTSKGTIYVAETPAGNFNLRDFDTSGTGAKWTIDVTQGALGNLTKWELKFK